MVSIVCQQLTLLYGIGHGGAGFRQVGVGRGRAHQRLSDGGEGEPIRDYLRRADAYALLGDEKKAIGKTLLGLGSRIGVIDSLSNDEKAIANLKAALLREFRETAQVNF